MQNVLFSPENKQKNFTAILPVFLCIITNTAFPADEISRAKG
jgi:hypothetical protein